MNLAVISSSTGCRISSAASPHQWAHDVDVLQQVEQEDDVASAHGRTSEGSSTWNGASLSETIGRTRGSSARTRSAVAAMASA